MKAKQIFVPISALACLCAGALTAQVSPATTESATVGGKTISIKYGAPSVRGRQIFGDGGKLSTDPTYPAWRAGADNATAFHTDADLTIGGLSVPKGDYTIYVWVKDPNAWELIINKQTGQWGTVYDASKDLGRVKMNMSVPRAPVETVKYTLSGIGTGAGKLEIAWEKHVASVPVFVK
jgi:hypothetical protein